MRTGGRDSTILPLIESGAAYSPRRQRSLQFADILRFVFRRKFKFYVFASILLVIMILTIVHRRTLRYDHMEHHRNDHQAAPNARRRGRFEAPQTMRTIVGKYVGPKPDWEYNMSAEIVNTNSYDPSPEMGRDGRPVYLPAYPKDRMQMLYSINSFNLAVSDKIPVDRKLPDPRKSACRQKNYDDLSNVTTSIIIIFHNEAWSVLMRTVHSVLNTAPHHLLAEILLVDDCSNRTFLGQALENYINNLSSVRGVDIKLIRSRERIGLIRGRLLGVEHAKGEPHLWDRIYKNLPGSENAKRLSQLINPNTLTISDQAKYLPSWTLIVRPQRAGSSLCCTKSNQIQKLQPVPC